MQSLFDFLNIKFFTGMASMDHGHIIEYDYILVAISYAFAFAGSFVGLLTSRQIMMAKSNTEKWVWRGCGAAAMGGGVWSMHFVGMLAIKWPMEVSYGAAMTALSILPSFFASLIALYMLSQKKAELWRLLFCGTLVGAGIGVMHFTGMAAMRMDMDMGYEPYLFALSIVVAVVLAVIALSVKFRLEGLSNSRYWRFANPVSAAVMGAAISGMHYTAMISVQHHPGPAPVYTGPIIDDGLLIIVVNLMMLALMILVATSVVVRRSFANSSLINAIIDKSSDGFLACDTKGTISLFSPGAEKLFGYSKDEMLGKNLNTLLPTEMADWHREKLKLASGLSEESIMGENREVQAYHKNGHEISMEITVSRVNNGHSTTFCATMRDISVRKSLEISREATNRKLEDALEQQKMVNQMQRDFVTMASHEFRTPLAIIDGSAQRLLRKKSAITEEYLEGRVAKIRGAVSRMQRLMESFLVSAKSELGSIELSLKQVDIASLIAKQCLESETLNPAYKINTDLEELPSSTMIDPLLFAQVLGNLMSNAIKYSPAADQIDIRGWTSPGQLHLSIRDYGLGIPSDEIENVSSRFFRASTSSGIPGTGIGLNLAFHIVEQHGGSIELESTVGEGTTFTVTLPCITKSDDVGNSSFSDLKKSMETANAVA